MLKSSTSWEFYRWPWGQTSVQKLSKHWENGQTPRRNKLLLQNMVLGTNTATLECSTSRTLETKRYPHWNVPGFCHMPDMDLSETAARIRSLVTACKAPSRAIESVKLTCMESGTILRDVMISNLCVGWSDVFYVSCRWSIVWGPILEGTPKSPWGCGEKSWNIWNHGISGTLCQYSYVLGQLERPHSDLTRIMVQNWIHGIIPEWPWFRWVKNDHWPSMLSMFS